MNILSPDEEHWNVLSGFSQTPASVMKEGTRAYLNRDMSQRGPFADAVERFYGIREAEGAKSFERPAAGRDVNFWALTNQEVVSLKSLGFECDHEFRIHTVGGFAYAVAGRAMKTAFAKLSAKPLNRLKVITNNFIDAWFFDPSIHICLPTNPESEDIRSQQFSLLNMIPNFHMNCCRDPLNCSYAAEGVYIDRLTCRITQEDELKILDESSAILVRGTYPFSLVLADNAEGACHFDSDHTGFFISKGKVITLFKTVVGFRMDPSLPLYKHEEIMGFFQTCHLQREHRYVSIPEELHGVGQTYALTKSEWGSMPPLPFYRDMMKVAHATRGVAKVSYPDVVSRKKKSIFVDARLIHRVRSEAIYEKATGTELYSAIFDIVNDYFQRHVCDNMMNIQINPVLSLEELRNISWAIYFQRYCDKASFAQLQVQSIEHTLRDAIRQLRNSVQSAVSEAVYGIYDGLISVIIQQKKYPSFIDFMTTISWPHRSRELIVRGASAVRLIDDSDEFYMAYVEPSEKWEEHVRPVFDEIEEEGEDSVDQNQLPAYDSFSQDDCSNHFETEVVFDVNDLDPVSEVSLGGEPLDRDLDSVGISFSIPSDFDFPKPVRKKVSQLNSKFSNIHHDQQDEKKGIEDDPGGASSSSTVRLAETDHPPGTGRSSGPNSNSSGEFVSTFADTGT